jgi:hypothetical protein
MAVFLCSVKVGDDVAVGVPFKPWQAQDDTIPKEEELRTKDDFCFHNALLHSIA